VEPITSKLIEMRVKSFRSEVPERKPKKVSKSETPDGHRVNSARLKYKSDEMETVRSKTGYFQTGGVNKDSSRDSAYGLSSGESKTTTRESTPEKTGGSSADDRIGLLSMKDLSEGYWPTTGVRFQPVLSNTTGSSMNHTNFPAEDKEYLPYLDENTNANFRGIPSG